MPRDAPPPSARGAAAGHRVRLVAVCNVTPDSFSGDGWLQAGNGYQDLADGNALAAQLARLVEEGAAVVDVGAESTAPGSAPVPQPEEARRLRPVLAAARGLLAARPGLAAFSVDTVHAATAREALRHGCTIVNDVSGARADPEMLSVLAARPECKLVMMYSVDPGGRPSGEYPNRNGNVFSDILRFFDVQVDRALREGLQRHQLILDPGSGAFVSPRAEDSIDVLRRIPEIKRRYQLPVLAGPSRKGFLASLVRADFGAGRRVGASLAAGLLAAEGGADYLRVHDVLATRDFLDAHAALRAAPPPPGADPAPRL